ncbi:hypothetical protein [Thiorhodococcus minor]|uniref:Uncharacterized protein n=1 Tax=Thiorhodococcus minor TaxID=57489 RepID=A0A6M0K6S0_9GAMM|nr:hypothetical protein [Thiorhodococcus minor]NEV65430.1 hypothetical protein [Thiorhodococcus minor]
MKISKYRKSEDWSLSEERQFFENLYSQRFNFFIVVYSVVVAGVISAKEFEEKVFVLTTGAFLVFVVGLSLYRACHKLLIILTLLHRTKQHPVRKVGRIARRYNWPLSISVNHLTGVYLPIASFFFLLAWLFAVIMKGANG